VYLIATATVKMKLCIHMDTQSNCIPVALVVTVVPVGAVMASVPSVSTFKK